MIRSRWCAALASVALLITIGVVDFSTGPQIAFGVVYFVPVALMAWRVGRTAALAMAFAATVAWYLGDAFYGLGYSSPWYGLWNGATRAGALVVIAILVSALRDAENRQASANQQLKKNLDELERSTAHIRELQGQLQLVCSWTNRIQSEGRWMRFEEFMQRNFNLAFSHGMSEEALSRMKQQIEGTLPDGEDTSRTT